VGRSLITPVFQTRSQKSAGAETGLGTPEPRGLHDVKDGQIAPHEMNELTKMPSEAVSPSPLPASNQMRCANSAPVATKA